MVPSSLLHGVLLLVVAASAAVGVAIAAQHGKGQVPPLLPPHFIVDYEEMYTGSSALPPFPQGKPPLPWPQAANRGVTYYDSAHTASGSMIETRAPGCLPIFVSPADPSKFSCTFLNTNFTTWLITHGNDTNMPTPCCKFASPWHPPRRDFLRRPGYAVVAATNIAWNFTGPCDPAQQACANLSLWLQIPTVTPPTGPFFYAFRQRKAASSASSEGILEPVDVYRSFGFAGVPPANYVQQAFGTARVEKPHPSVWDVPASCHNAPSCGFFGVDERRYHARFDAMNQ